VLTWCRLCGTEHLPDLICPAQLDATGPEKPRWRVAVETPHGVRGYGVLVAESGARWRSRIVTFPNVLWMVPGGGETLKFMAKTEHDAIRRAVDFIRRHCVSKGYTMRDEISTRPYVRGSVGMPKAGKDTGGGQIFITHVPTPHLDGNYTIFGEVVGGIETLQALEAAGSQSGETSEPVGIEKVTIEVE